MLGTITAACEAVSYPGKGCVARCSMTVVMVKTTTNDAAGIGAAEATAKTIFNATSATAC